MRRALFLLIHALFTDPKAVFFCTCCVVFVAFVSVVSLWSLYSILGLAKVVTFFRVEGDQ